MSEKLPDLDESGGTEIDDAWRRHAESADMLQAILDGPRMGEIEGVLFDFRHDKLPSADLWHAPDGQGQPYGISFPWDRALYSGDAGAAASGVTDGASDDEGGGVMQIYAGDRVTVDRLARFRRGRGNPPYVDPHDAYSLAAYLVVERQDGTAEKIEEPIFFNARDAIGPASPYFYAGDDGLDEWVGDFRVTYDKLSRRLDRLNQTVKFGEAREWVELANEAQEGAEDERDAIAAALNKGVVSPLPLDLARLVDLAATVGYALAMAERAPVVDAAQNRTRLATKARRAVTDPVREAAKKDIRANPKTTQTACARRLALKLRRDQRSMEKLIAPLFEWVTLPGGAKEKRPRRIYINPRQIDGWPGLPSV